MRRLVTIWKMQPIQEKTILNNAKDKNQIVFGARSIQKQLGIISRPTQDFDIFTSEPKSNANLIQKKLDKQIGFNFYYSKKGKNKTTYKVKSKGYDLKKGTKDDQTIVDYTKTPSPTPKTILSDGVRYRVLKEEIDAKKRIIKDKSYAFRHDKDKKDLILIKSLISSRKPQLKFPK